MEVKYETEKKELRITSLEKERQLYVWLGLAGVLLAIALGFVLWQKVKNARKEKLLIATRSVLDGEMRERTRLAQDLHDRLSGNLSAVKIELNNYAESLQGVRDKLDNCIKDIRNAAHDLMPAALQFGMKVALEDFAAQFPNVRFHFFGKEKRIDGRMEFVVYCCASELVNNSIKHSGAKNINLQLVQDEKYVSLTVSDDGCGFDEKAVAKGFGLKSIHDRVTSCNGKIDIATSPGKGTETTIELRIEN
jgi:signal transduction histidine kinase